MSVKKSKGKALSEDLWEMEKRGGEEAEAMGKYFVRSFSYQGMLGRDARHARPVQGMGSLSRRLNPLSMWGPVGVSTHPRHPRPTRATSFLTLNLFHKPFVDQGPLPARRAPPLDPVMNQFPPICCCPVHAVDATHIRPV